MTTWWPRCFCLAWGGLGLLLAGACTPPQPPPAPAANVVVLQADTPVLNRLWLRQKQVWLLRQTALLEAGPNRLTMNALLRLDMEKHSARVVAMDDFGVKLFDLTVTAVTEDCHFLLPALTRLTGIDRMIAATVRRTYLLPASDSPGKVESDQFIIGKNGLLQGRRGDLQHEHWQIHYLGYRETIGVLHPVHIVMEDLDAGYRLTVWTEEVKEDEQP